MSLSRFAVILSTLTLCALVLVGCGAPEVIPLPPTRTVTVRLPTATASSAPLTAAATPEAGQLLRVQFHAPAPSRNMLGEMDDRVLQIYLPPSYATTENYYPVIYYLPDFGDQDMLGVFIPGDVDRLIEKGAIKETILVVAGGASALGGGFFVNSPVSGAWDDYITKDVVSFIDANYRSLPQPASRGIAGHGVGGFGALHLAMLHPDVFGSVYALSPTLFDPDGLAEAPELSLPQTIADVVDAQARESVMTPENALLDMKSATADVRFSLAYAVAFAPDPARNPPYDYPYHLENGKIVRDQTVWDRWDQGLGGLAEKIRRYHANLLKLNGIMLDYGRSDADAWIPNGSEYFVAQLHMAGVPGQVLPYAGDHQTGLADRIRESMLPFFSTRLLSGNP